MTRPSVLDSADLLIGIDDTDVIGTRGTGWLSQRLLAQLRDDGLGEPLGATRHQLLVDPRIPYTSHNSSACIVWRTTGAPDARERIAAAAAAFLRRESADGSDPGLALVPPAELTAAARARLVAFGRSAKEEVLDQPRARGLANELGVHLSGHGGTEDGVIGSLAATGLHLSGADGLFLWMDGIRALDGRCTLGELLARVPIDAARTLDGESPAADDDDLIVLGEWVRPILSGGRAVLLLEPLDPGGGDPGGDAPRWRVAPREVVKRH